MKTLLKQIRNEWRSNLFLFVELLLVFTVLWYIVDWTVVTARVYNAPMGFDTDHCYNIDLGKYTPKAAAYNPELTAENDMEDLLQIVDRLKHRPGVEAVALSQNCYPYNDGSNGVRIAVDTVLLQARFFIVEPDYFRVFRFQAADGSGPDKLVEAVRRKEIVITSNLTDDYPELGFADATPLLGREVPYWDPKATVRHRIGAIAEPTRWSHFYTSHEYGGAFITTTLDMDLLKEYGEARYITLSLRVAEDEDHDFIDRLMDDADRLYQVGNLYLLNTTSFDDLREISELENMNEVKTQLCVLGFLLMNIFLGVIGTFWFRTQHRRGEVALRMAMGSSRSEIFQRLMAEGVVLLTLAAVPAIVIAFNIGIAELVDVAKMHFTADRFLIGIALTWLLMALMIVAGIWYPASRAMKVQPAEALHDE